MKYAILLGTSAFLIVGCGGNSLTGFHDPKVLTQSVRTEFQNVIDDPAKMEDLGYSDDTYVNITDVYCLAETESKFSCVMEYTVNNKETEIETTKIVVAKDGRSWVRADS
jgi:hypothetical protein